MDLYLILIELEQGQGQQRQPQEFSCLSLNKYLQEFTSMIVKQQNIRLQYSINFLKNIKKQKTIQNSSVIHSKTTHKFQIDQIKSKIFDNYKISTIKMSKFYAEGNASDDSDDEQQINNQNIDRNRKKKFDVDDDQYHNEEKNKMQTEKEKKNALFKKLSSATLSALNIGDFDKTWDNLQEFLKEIEKAAKFIEKQGLPNSFLRTLVAVNGAINETDPSKKQKIKNSKTAKSFTIMKQKLKNKILPEYKDKLANFKDEESEQQSESESPIQSSSEQSQEQVYKRYLDSDDPHIRRKYWLKRQKKQQSEEQRQRQKQKQEQQQKHRHDKDEKQKDKKAKPKYNLVAQKKKQETIIASAKDAQAKLAKILKQFAKLSTAEKRQEYLETLNNILKLSKDYQDYQKLSLLLIDISIRIQVTRQLTRQYGQTNFPRASWNKIFSNIVSVFNILRQSEDQDLLKKIATFQINSDESAILGTTQKEVYTQINSFLNTLQRELSRSFDFLESSQLEYSDRLQDLIKLVEFMYKISKELTFKPELEKQAALLSFKVLQNMYFMSHEFIQKINKSSSDLTFVQLSDENTLEEYVKPILKLQDQSMTTKTLLYVIYNHAVNRRDKGKDLLSLTDLSQTITSRDYYTQVCFNRTLVQLGISAFHQGNLFETQQILSTICSLGKNREENKDNIKTFLGQAKVQQTARHKLFPYYLHLNIDFIEAIELVASMLLEVPFTLMEGGKITSRSFKKLAYQYEKSHFLAEPLNYRDLVYAASNQLKLGNMQECYDRLTQIDIWREIGNSDEALSNLKDNVKETALKCYILSNKNCFLCISLQGLSKKFNMPFKSVKRIICRQINDRKIQGTITPDNYLNLTEKRKQKESGLRNISNNLFTKLEQLNRVNEQISKQRNEIVDQEEQADKEAKASKRLPEVITEKLKNIISRRAA